MPSNPNNPIDNFVTDLLTEAGLQDVSEAKQKEYHQNILALVQQKLGMEIMKVIPPEKIDEFIKLTEQGAKPEVLHDFFQKNISDFDKKVKIILETFRKDFISMSQPPTDS